MPLSIDVYADLVCPWCYIGKRHLERALADLAARGIGIGAQVSWMPFFLNPESPPEGEPYRPFLEAKFGGKAQVDALQARVAEAGRGAGIEFAFDRIETRPNSLDGHRLIYRAQRSGQASGKVAALVERLFAAHFVRGEDIGDVATLARIAGESGDDEKEVLAFLNGGEAVEAVLELAARVQATGIGGVPLFVINRRIAVSGAQPPAVLADAIERGLP